MAMKKIDAIRCFVRNNYKLINNTDFNRVEYRNIKKDYFGRELKHKFGIPSDKNICDVFIEALIKNEKILSKDNLQEKIELNPFLKLKTRAGKFCFQPKPL